MSVENLRVDAIVSQYRAALSMLRSAIETCPDDLWDASVGRHAFWLIAYHAMFYADLYLCGSEESFQPPEFARVGEQFMDKQPEPPHERIEIGEPYTREQLLAYHTTCVERVEAIVPGETESDLAAAVSFDWIPFSRFELHLYNIRHIQHHVAQLSLELKFQTGTGVDWVKQ